MKSMHCAHCMGNISDRSFRSAQTFLLILILVLSNLSLMIHSDMDNDNELADPPNFFVSSSKASGGDVDVPAWRIGDKWTYDGFMDVGSLLTDNGVSSNIQTITGEMDMEVKDILTMTVENQSTLVYKVEYEGLFEANGVELSGYNGNLDVDYLEVDYIRVSDLAVIEMTMDIDVTFQVFIITIDVGHIIVTNSYTPPQEQYDFPLRVGDTWTNNYTNNVTWSGSSDYFTIPDDTSSHSSSRHSVVSQGDPGVPYSGCSGSYNITTYNQTWVPEGFLWWCPAVKNNAWRHIYIDLGMSVDFKLKSVDLVTRNMEIDVEFNYPAWPLDTNLSTWVNITDGSGNPIGSQTVEFRYECVGFSATLTTASNGSAFIRFDSDHALDPSPSWISPGEYASHGVIAWISSSKTLGVDTIILDEHLTAVDYLPRPSGVSVERTRDGVSTSLNPTVGYNAIPGDTLVFNIPVLNAGFLSGPSTELEVTAPDGSTSRGSVPALGGLQEASTQVTWIIPNTQPIGTVQLGFEVDPDDLMIMDANQSNDAANFSVFIGRLPTANITQTQAAKTLTEVHIDARNSNDPDGGGLPHCTFVVEVDVATNQTFEEEDCLLENTWSDDGTYRVWLTITDDENDQDSTFIDVEILNRAPWVNVSSQYPTIPVESPNVFFASDSGDLDTLNIQAPVDFLWQLPTASDGSQYVCESGLLVEATCTITPMDEGIFTAQVTVQDDDGDFTTGEFNLVVTNIAPSDAEITMWNGSVEITDDRNPPIWEVMEDQVVTLKGTAHDSLNDMDSLTWGWQPDVDVNPSWYVETVGSTSEIDVSWNTSGSHVIAMEAIDDDGESSGVANGWVRVMNVGPTVEQFSPLLPIGEDRELSLTGVFSDTASDMETLEVCWDVDFAVDFDENGDTMDDCDFVGADITHHWTDSGQKMIRFHVTDDDGDSAEAFVNVTVVNLKPNVVATPEKLTVQVGEELVIWTNETTDSSSDMPELIFNWDFDSSSDFDDDGNPLNDIQAVTSYGEPLRHTFASEGTKNIRLTVYDENFTNPATVDIVITVIPDDSGVLGWVDSKGVGGVSNIVIALGLVLVALLIVLGLSMFRNKGSSNDDWMVNSALYSEPSPTAAPPTYAFGDAPPAVAETPAGVPPAQETEQAYSPPQVQQPVAEAPAQIDVASLDDIFASTSTAPPVPALGLPEGWSMEQWEHYGAQWLEEQSAASDNSATGGLDFDL